MEEAEYFTLKKNIDKRIINLDHNEFEWDHPSFDLFIVQFPIFKILTSDEI